MPAAKHLTIRHHLKATGAAACDKVEEVRRAPFAVAKRVAEVVAEMQPVETKVVERAKAMFETGEDSPPFKDSNVLR